MLLVILCLRLWLDLDLFLDLLNLLHHYFLCRWLLNLHLLFIRLARINQWHFFIYNYIFVNFGKLFDHRILFLLSDFVIPIIFLYMCIKKLIGLFLSKRKSPINRINFDLVLLRCLVDLVQPQLEARPQPLVLRLEYLHLDFCYLFKKVIVSRVIRYTSLQLPSRMVY